MNQKCFVICALFFVAVGAHDHLRLCAQEDVTETSCNALSRSDSPIKCERVVDSVECAIKLADGRADFGVFTADELLLAHSFYPTGIQVVAELKNKDKNKVYDLFEFQSVVVVPRNHTTQGDELGLAGSGYCHPGFSKSQLWNDHVLKYFEKKVLQKVCRKGLTTAENELINLRDFFKKACRPGNWVPDDVLDKKLKKKYPQLCELCPDQENCKYQIPQNHGHMDALDCLTSGRGQVAYVSLEYVKSYFSPNQSGKRLADYQFLCENGSRMDLDVENPCTWYKQPWKVILSRVEVAKLVDERIEKVGTPSTFSAIPWEKNFYDILFKDDTPIMNNVSPFNYLRRAMDKVELPKSDCGQPIRWCTTSKDEWAKCNWTAAAAQSLGIQPDISCVMAWSPFECFDWISNNDADIMTIDSNYGLLARKVYGLSALLYCETMEDRYSVVVAVTRDRATLNKISKWNDLKGKNACFPEFGGIAWLSFINAARDHRLLSDSCAYPKIVSKLLKGACAPGFNEADHAQDHKKPSLLTDGLGNLCDLCPTQPNGERCEANNLNKYYGDKGALDCLKSGDGDIAFLESRNLNAFVNDHSINASDYRVLCKNGSLADSTGFNIDKTCALSVAIDSEVVSRRDQSDPHLIDATLVLLKIEDWLGYRGDSERRAVHIYDPFKGANDLLFKNSTVGLVPFNSEVRAVIAYKELFRHADGCSSAEITIAVVALVLINFFIARWI